MGSIIGALYAVGYSPDEMQEILSRIAWEKAFRDKPDRERIPFRRKEDDRLGLFPMEIGIGRRGVSMKPGVLVGTKIDFIFHGVTIEAAGVEHFDDLRIPFRAVATDLRTGDAVVLERGDLALAMRASMAIPGAFTPVEIDGRLLVDGGIANNLPVDVARRMGARRIIAIDVGTPPETDLEKLSAIGVLGQTLSVLTEKNVEEQRETVGPGDLLILPELGEVATADFAEIDAAIAAGEAAARRLQDDLRAFSVPEEEYAEFLRRQRRAGAGLLPDVTIDEIVVRGVPRLDPEVVTRRMETRPGQRLDLATLYRDLERVNVLGEFEAIGFRLERDGERHRLVVEARERSVGPGYLRLGLGLEATFDGAADFRVLGHYRRAHVNRLGAEWKLVTSIGDPTALAAEFYQPLDPTGLWFVAPSLVAERDQEEIFVPSGDFEEVQSRRLEGTLDFGMTLRNYGEVRLGLVAGRRRFEELTTSSLDPVDRDVGAWRFRFVLDQIDNVFFPTRGNYTAVEALFSREALGADDEYDKVSLLSQQAATLGRNTLLGSIRLGSDLGSTLPLDDQFSLGGFLNLSGFKRGRLRGDASALFTVADYWRIGELGPFGRLYFGAALQAGNAWPGLDEADLGDLVYSGLAFFGVDCPPLPVYLGYGLAEGGEDQIYLVMGRVF
jgi:NTE family protein